MRINTEALRILVKNPPRVMGVQEKREPRSEQQPSGVGLCASERRGWFSWCLFLCNFLLGMQKKV